MVIYLKLDKHPIELSRVLYDRVEMASVFMADGVLIQCVNEVRVFKSRQGPISKHYLFSSPESFEWLLSEMRYLSNRDIGHYAAHLLDL